MSSNSKQSQFPKEVAKVDDAYLSAMILCFSRVFPAILNAAIDLNLFEIIAKAQRSCASSLSASEVASLLPNQHPQLVNRLERILPVLASYSLLNCSIRNNEDGNRERVYTLSSVGAYFMMDVKDAIVDPSNNNHFQKIRGMPCYQYMETNNELNHHFNKAMAQSSPLEMKRTLMVYKGFEEISTLVDVGGGVGQTLKIVISEYPSIKGINFDLPQVVRDAPPHPGIEHVGGDMFESVPTGDAILLKFVCHNWTDEECVKFLKNCHKALPQHGKVIVQDYVIPEVPDSSKISKFTCALDNVMFLITGGKERTEKEFERLCKSSGFSKFHVACSEISVMTGLMEFYK
ncbi:hypothetical protein CR513_51287, partial [Mucuna pruriens]